MEKKFDLVKENSVEKLWKKKVKENSDLEKQLMWFNHFVDYVGQMNSNLYNEACEYSDNCEDC